MPPRAQSLRRRLPIEDMSSSSEIIQPTPTLRTIHIRRNESFLKASTTGFGMGMGTTNMTSDSGLQRRPPAPSTVPAIARVVTDVGRAGASRAGVYGFL